MRRRDFIKLVGGVAATWPMAARAQQSGMPVIGLLNASTREGAAVQLAALRVGLNEVGFIDGQNVTIEYRGADTQYDRLPALADELVRRRVDVIATTGGTTAAIVAKAATSSIPVVFSVGGDPLEAGLVAHLNRPGSNVTGVTTLTQELLGKRIELLHEVVPHATTISYLINPATLTVNARLEEAQLAAHTLGLQLQTIQVSTVDDIDAAFAALDPSKVGALLIASGALFASEVERLARLAADRTMPAMHYLREFITSGGLMSYGSSVTEQYRLAGVYVGRILKGEKPGDLPVQRATKVELLLNLKTARALGVSVPLPLIGRADEVIE